MLQFAIYTYCTSPGDGRNQLGIQKGYKSRVYTSMSKLHQKSHITTNEQFTVYMARLICSSAKLVLRARSGVGESWIMDGGCCELILIIFMLSMLRHAFF